MKFKVNISKDNKECLENENLGKGNYSCKSRSNVTKVKDFVLLCQDKFIHQCSSQYHEKRERKARKTEFLLRSITRF